ncbi:putative cyclin-D7-1 [Phragmites australis]|uniref:putative cyclin-D7-1 n=1 Tax=Phragmites australis TaxID=29695 RepID=UPI002D790287|nr:putative cyclin-D7-1 [Phragmites australis]
MEEDDNDEGCLLYCHEEPLVSTPAEAGGPRRDPADDGIISIELPGRPSSVAAVVVGDEEDDHQLDEILMDYMARQRCYAPSRSYLEQLMQGSASASSISHARSRGVCYITYAFGRLGLAAATAFNAVNYLDRFLSINCHLRWEAWMVELVSVACVSIACKLDEVNIPSLHHLQMEEAMSNSFRPSTIRDMELTLLKALQWRLACVTPYSFLQLLLPLTRSTAAAAASRCTRLLVASLSEPSLLRFDSSVIASSALRCVALQDHHQGRVSCHVSRLIHPERPLDKDADECLSMMKALQGTLDLKNHHHSFSEQLWSPVSVIPFQTDQSTDDRSTVCRRLFDRSIPQQGSTEHEDGVNHRHIHKR